MFYLTTHSTHFMYSYMASDIWLRTFLIGYSFRLTARALFYMHHPTDRIAHTTASVTRVVEHWLEREIAQWVQPMKDRSDDPSHHERTLLPRSYISLHKTIEASNKLLSSFKFQAHTARCSSLIECKERDVAPW